MSFDTGNQRISMKEESQKSNTAPDLMRDVNRIKQRVKPSNFHTSGSPEFLTSAESGEKLNTTTGGIDEGNFGPITRAVLILPG